MNSDYIRIFRIPQKAILQFISLVESCNQRFLIKEFKINYDNIMRCFVSEITFPDGEDYLFFHNVGVQFMSGIEVEN
jgi:hypothetical protein